MSNSASLTLEDFDGEKSTTQLNPGPLTSVNYDAKRAALDSLKSAVSGITLGEMRATSFTIKTGESTDPVTDPQAQREAKWLVTYRDNTEFLDVGDTIENTGFGNLYSVEIPTADLDLLENNSDSLVLDDGGVVAAFVTAFEAFQNSPTGGNEISVVSIRHVGRSI